MINDDQQQLVQDKFTSKQIIIYNKNQITDIILPVFISLKILHFTEINLDELYAKMHCTLRLFVYYGKLPSHIIQYIESRLRLNFFMDQTIVLCNDGSDDDQIYIKRKKKYQNGQHVRNYIVKAQLTARIDPFVFLTPFELLDLRITASLQSTIVHVVNEIQTYNFHFNCMDLEVSQNQEGIDTNSFKKILFTESGSINYYDLAEQKLFAEYTYQHSPQSIYILKPTFKIFKTFATWNKQRKQKRVDKILKQKGIQSQKTDQIRVYNYAHFHLPVYKFPFVSLATIYFPLWLLGTINLALYWAENDLALRLQGISLLTLGYVQLILVVREQIPISPGLTLIQIAVYGSLVSSMLLLVDSLSIRNKQIISPTQSTGYYAISALILIIQVFGPILAYLYHKLFTIPSYNIQTSPPQQNLSYWALDLNHNQDANKYYSSQIKDQPDNFFMEKHSETRFYNFIKDNLSNKNDWNL